MNDQLAQIRTAIHAAMAEPAGALIGAYFDDNGPFASTTFDLLGAETPSPNELTAEDLLAASLLDVSMPPPLVRAVFGRRRGEVADLLNAIPHDVDLWEATDAHLAAATAAWNWLCAFHGVSWVKAGKLLARKRPRLIPVLDSVVMAALPLTTNDAWKDLRAALDDQPVRDAIEAARPADLDPRITTLRLLDVAMWMRGSESRNAITARVSAGLSG